MKDGCAYCRNYSWESCEPDKRELNEQMIRHAGRYEHDVVLAGSANDPLVNL